MEWLIRLHGDDFLLQQLPSMFTHDEIRVMFEGDAVYLRATTLQSLPDAASVAAAAPELVRLVRAACELTVGSALELEVAAIEGRDAAAARLAKKVSLRRIATGRVYRTGTAGDRTGAASATPLSSVERALHRARLLPATQLALSSYRAESGWAELRRAIDAVSDAAGGPGVIEAYGWATTSAIQRLKQTADSVGGSDDARRGNGAAERPAKPMDLSEARAVVAAILRGLLLAAPATAKCM